MRKGLFLAISLTTAALLLLTSGLAIAQGNEQVIKVGKKGDVVFSETTQIGDVALKPGHYQFQHRVAGGEHFVKFTELMMSQGRHAGGSAMGAKDAGEIKCTAEPLKSKVTQTAIYSETSGGVKKVTRIEVAGETVAHVF